MHYERWRTKGDPVYVTKRERDATAPKVCSIDGCGKAVRGRGWCSMHYRRWQQHGDPNIRLREYGTGRRTTVAGYVEVWCPGHAQAMSHGYALEHRKVMHDLGYDITGAEVHHIDNVRSNNDPTNLMVMAGGDHQRHHAKTGTTNQFGHHDPRPEVCDVCDRPVSSGRYCVVHYSRWNRTGDPLGVRRVDKNTVKPYRLMSV